MMPNKLAIVVEDDPDDLRILMTGLQASGFTVLPAPNTGVRGSAEGINWHPLPKP